MQDSLTHGVAPFSWDAQLAQTLHHFRVIPVAGDGCASQKLYDNYYTRGCYTCKNFESSSIALRLFIYASIDMWIIHHFKNSFIRNFRCTTILLYIQFIKYNFNFNTLEFI